MQITTFVLKVASRCNLDCTYCYVYNRADTQWLRQPKFMSPKVAHRAGEVIGEYCRSAGLAHVNVQFHGGEPLMLGEKRLEALIDAVRRGIGDVSTEISSAMQTNGLLLTESILEMLSDKKVGLYVSCDGPASASDLARIDHQARPVSDRLHQKLEMLAASKYHKIFQGFLCVINPQSDPKKVFAYLAGFHPKAIDFLLPLENHDTADFGPETRGLYALWLMKCFNAWITSPIKLRSRGFEQIVHAHLSQSNEDTDADFNAGSLVIECDGSIEADDTLKTTYDGAAVLGCDVFHHSIVDVLDVARFQDLTAADKPCSACQGCAHFHACRSGHLTHRYAAQNGFDNPSIYCAQNKQVIDHIGTTLLQFMQPEKEPAFV